MKVKTADLIGPALDWAVAQCEKEVLSQAPLSFQIKEYGCLQRPHLGNWKPSVRWSQGGPIIDRMMQGKFFLMENDDSCCHVAYSETEHDNAHGHGPAPLVAAMRCFVASRLGDEVNIPEELL